MTGGSRAFRPADVPENNASSYPEPFREGDSANVSTHVWAIMLGSRTTASTSFGSYPAASRRPVTRIRSRMSSST